MKNGGQIKLQGNRTAQRSARPNEYQPKRYSRNDHTATNAVCTTHDEFTAVAFVENGRIINL
jgi:hypothetical protein